MEMMTPHGGGRGAVRARRPAGRAAAVLLVEVDGTPAVAPERGGRGRGAEHGAAACASPGRGRGGALWKARKSAFGAMARVAPNYYLHDCVVPRTRWSRC